MYNKVNSQFNHAIELNDDISKFNCLWISFNCFYNIKYKQWSDRDKIEIIKNLKEAKSVFLKLNKDVKEKFYKFINKRINNWVVNLKFNRTEEYKSLNCFSEFLEIIYTIRNNQFHWWKNWNKEEDLYLLIETSKVFQLFLQEFYTEYWIIWKK